uniref:Metallothionein-like protein n=1 Tax=Zea mays TaxID=4577 RepID=B6T845_MAIZE|nr:metallothionein-like protein type 2 [Zea mays]
MAGRLLPRPYKTGARPQVVCPLRLCSKMYPDMAEQVTTTTQALIMGVAPSKGHAEGGFEAAAGAENGGCKCGGNCQCDPCNCGK